MYEVVKELDGKSICRCKNLEELVREVGVSDEQIERMKEKKLVKGLPYYDNVGKCYDRQLVPLDKVIGTSRCDEGKSVFDNIQSIEGGKRLCGRFKDCFSYYEKYGLKGAFKKLNTETGNQIVKMEHYVEDDLYYVYNGNHRTLLAMLMGAKTILARVRDLHCNYSLKKNWQLAQKFYDMYQIEGIYTSRLDSNMITIFFRENEKIKSVTGYSVNLNGNCEEIIRCLTEQIEEDRKNIRWVKKIPCTWREAISRFFCKNNRVWQYIDGASHEIDCLGRYRGERIRIEEKNN